MKYFTPELYQQLNSFDVNEAERADEAWDKAELAYRKRLAKIRAHLPPQVLKLSELCLHDALVASRLEQMPADTSIHPLPVFGMATGIISVTTGPKVVTLIYSLWDLPTKHQAPEGWRFSQKQEQWLYDEVDRRNDSAWVFTHRILFSTGVTLDIPFLSVIIHTFTVPAVTSLAKQSA